MCSAEIITHTSLSKAQEVNFLSIIIILTIVQLVNIMKQPSRNPFHILIKAEPAWNYNQPISEPISRLNLFNEFRKLVWEVFRGLFPLLIVF